MLSVSSLFRIEAKTQWRTSTIIVIAKAPMYINERFQDTNDQQRMKCIYNRSERPIGELKSGFQLHFMDNPFTPSPHEA